MAMVCNSTSSSSEGVCGGVGKCLPTDDGLGKCVCPFGYSTLNDCEITHYGVLPEVALGVGLSFFLPFLVLSFLYTYEYIWNFVKRPKLRLSLLQVFNLAMILLSYTRLWGCIHVLVNSQIGHTHVWGSIARQLTWSVGLTAMFMSLAMVVSLWYGMVLTIRNVSAKKSKSAKYVQKGLFVGGLVVVVVGLATAILQLFFVTDWVIAMKTIAFTVYKAMMFLIASVSVYLARDIWCGTGRDDTKAKREFSRKVRVMIGWIVTGLLQMCAGIVLNAMRSPLSEVFFISFSTFCLFDIALAVLALLFNQHYIYPFAGFNCCSGGPESATSTTSKHSSSRFSIATSTSPIGTDSGSVVVLTPEGEELFQKTQFSSSTSSSSSSESEVSETDSMESASTSTQSEG